MRQERRQGRDVGVGKGKMWARVMYDACQIVIIKESCIVGKPVTVAIIAVGHTWVYHCHQGHCHRGMCMYNMYDSIDIVVIGRKRQKEEKKRGKKT